VTDLQQERQYREYLAYNHRLDEQEIQAAMGRQGWLLFKWLFNAAVFSTFVEVAFSHERRQQILDLFHRTPTLLAYISVALVVMSLYTSASKLLSFVPKRIRRLSSVSKPPVNAEFLFYLFMTPQNCDAFVGDLEERYKLIRKKFGKSRADFWFWTQTVISLGPIVWAWAKKISLKPVIALIGWAVAKGLLGHDSWLATLVEMLKKVRS